MKTEEDYGHYDLICYITIMIFSLIFIILYIIYISLVITYIIKNYHTKKLCVLWIDYCILLLTAILFIILYISNLIYHYTYPGGIKNIRIDNPKDLSGNLFTILIISSLVILCISIISSLFFDTITAIQLSLKMVKIKKIVEKDFLALSDKFKNINIVNILKIEYTYKYYIIFGVINIIYLILFFLAYTDLEPKRIDGILNLYGYFDILLRYYHLIALLLLIISITFMNKSKKSLLRKQYYNPDRIAQKVYDVHFSQIVYFTDVISFKLVSDIIINIPPLLFLSLEKFNTLGLILSEISIFLFIFLGGSENLIIDKDTKAGKLDKKIRTWFCIKKLDFHFGEKDHKEIFDEFRFNYSKEEQSVIDNLNMTIIKNIEINLLDYDEDRIFSEEESRDSIFNIENNNGNKTLNKNINKNSKNNPKTLEFKTVPEFYLVQKLMMEFFKTNSKLYESSMNSLDEIGFDFKKLENGRKKRKSKFIQDKDIFSSNMDRISRLSMRDIEKIKPSLKISQNDLFNSIEEKELFDELKNKLNIKKENYFYKIESLLTNELFELFPFYKMRINNIYKSLNPARNIKVFNKFIKRNDNFTNSFSISNKDNRLSVKSNKKSISDSIKSEREEEFEKDLYYTHDLYLMYEIYDKKDFVNLDELNNIISPYKRYLLSVVQNMNFTFLPLIIGIFNLEIYDSNKIIVLYKNPLYFTISNHYTHWINFYITEEPEKIRVSSLFNDIIDVNEIEIKNSLQLNEADYNEVKEILEKDCNFLKKINYLFPIINLFIGNEIDNNDDDKEDEQGGKGKDKNKNINQCNENSILGELSLSKDLGIIDVLYGNLNNSNLNIGDESGNINNIQVDENTLFEKEYYFMSGKDIRTIKIYFTNFFRKVCELNKKEENTLINSETYCDYLQNQLIRYLKTDSLFKDEDLNKS